MAASWVTERKETENYTKLCRLLYDGGTLAVRTVFDGRCPPASLGAILKTNQCTLQTLMKPAGKVLNQHQWDLLYPPSGANPKSEDFDITLLFILLRNICGLTPPATGWNDLPPSTDTSLEANLVRIKYYRNNVIAHSSRAEVDDTLFEAYWSDISGPLVSLRLKQVDIDELKSSPLGAKDYNQLVEYWDLSDQEIKDHLEAIKTDTSEIKTIGYLLLNKQNTCTQVESEITKLAHIDFTSMIQRSCKLYHQSTRQWIFNQVEETVQKASSGASVVLIRAGPGMGKSIVAAKICDIYQKRGLLGGCHFFQHSNSLRNNPRMMLQSIARQLCNSLTGYQAALETKLKTLQGRNISDLNCEELFGLLFEEPLSQIYILVDHNVVIVIDALDECASLFKEEIEDVLKRKLSDLPSWIQFVITTRPLPSCCNLSSVIQIEIDPSDSRNVHDLKKFFTFKLSERNVKHLIDKLMEMSNGLFLVAHFVLEILDENAIPNFLTCFPHGISSLYKHYFKRIRELVKPYIPHTSEKDEVEDTSFFMMLEAVVAAKSPIPKMMFYEILCLKSNQEVQRDERQKRKDAEHLLHTIFPVENDHISVFHKSVTDWLNLDGKNEHLFSVSASNGCEVLAQKSLDVLKAFKKAVEEEEKPFDQPLVLSDSERFALLFGLEYIKKSSKLSQTEKEEINKDFIIMVAILNCYTHNLLSIRKLLSSLYGVGDYLVYIINQCRRSSDLKSVFLKGKKLSFGLYLSIVGDVILSEDILPTEQKQGLKFLRIEYKLPYYSPHHVVSSLPSAFQHQSSSSFSDLFDISNGFIAVNVDPVAEPPTSTVLNIKDDGSYGEHKTFSSVHVRGVSPDKKFLIMTKTNSSKIELFDVTTLEKVQEYNCPVNCVHSCHIFGDEQWYIIVKAQGDPRIHILDGLNGQLHDTIEVGEDKKVEGVSQYGHILISDRIDDAVDNDDGTLKEVISLKTIHCNNRDEIIYYYPPEGVNFPDGGWNKHSLNQSFKFSDDGKYFALNDNVCSTVYIFNTNNGTLYKIVEKFYFMFGSPEIVFLSNSCLVVRSLKYDKGVSFLQFYDLLNSKLIYSISMKLIARSRLLVPARHHTDKSIPRTLFELTDDELVKYEFHNLE